ncbi:AfsR/SARP family transcriptional regulator [Nesterenkonia ebinurensis]|uniref:AfsR/SARP family transcriptional regulator n=1 Tax=Nesterenkonia ebinurensis TaxID=2608252 RepID=UPI00123E259D|nr:BTAD domain-containing putative transcriptional regulator [Nesterenkonia ebinurensis]
MRIEVLGPIRIRDDDGCVVEVPERKVRALLAALVTADGQAVPTETLLDQVWGQTLPANPARVLQSKLSQLRILLDSAAVGGRGVLTREPGGYRLEINHGKSQGAGEAVRTDADELRWRVLEAQAAAEPAEQLETLDGIQELWRGRPYGEFADELWVTADTTALEEIRLQAAELQAEALLATGRPQPAYAVVQPLLGEHSTREALVATAMHACYLTGRHPESLRLYERLRTHLAEELGADPRATTQKLHQKILRQDPELTPAPVPSGRTQAVSVPSSPHADARRLQGNLPQLSSALIGREPELATLKELILNQRLVTVLGAGGVGKTRLATAAAVSILADQDEGSQESAPDLSSAWFVDLTGLAGGGAIESITELMVTLLKLPAAQGDHETLLSRVAAALEERRALLVLDNCEHLIDAAPLFTAELLSRTEHVRVLATSREPLGFPEEQRLPLMPLAVECPVPDDQGSPAQGGAVQPSDAPAVRLFLVRTRAVAPQLQLSEQDHSIIAELCRRLDGLPLAIELAAGRMNTLTPQDLLERITDRLDLFAGSVRGAPRRQQTLRGMLDWSWELLDETEQALLRRLAVHPTSWTLDTIEAICSDYGMPAGTAQTQNPVEHSQAGQSADELGSSLLLRTEALPVLARLVDRSLVSTVHIEAESGTTVRYRLLETVATYAAEKLKNTGERPEVAARHIAYHRTMAECARDFVFGPHARDWIRWLDEEREHLRHAHAEALRTGDGANAVALILSTFWYRWMTGQLGGLVHALRSTVACQGPRDNSHKQAAVLVARVDESPDMDMSPRYREITTALAAFGDDEESVRARMQVQWFPATALITSEDYRHIGEQLAQEAIDYLAAHGDLHGAAFAAVQRDFFLLDHWNVPPQGLPGGHDAETILRESGDDYGLSQLLTVLHIKAENDGQTAAAEKIAEEVLELTVNLDFNGEAAYWFLIRALNSLRAGDFDAAEKAIEEALTLTRTMAFRPVEIFARAAQAAWATARGDTINAVEILDSLSAAEKHHGARWVTRILGEEALPTSEEFTRG